MESDNKGQRKWGYSSPRRPPGEQRETAQSWNLAGHSLPPTTGVTCSVPVLLAKRTHLVPHPVVPLPPFLAILSTLCSPSLPPSLCLWVGLPLHLCPEPFLLAVSVFSRVPCLPLLPVSVCLWQELFHVAHFPGKYSDQRCLLPSTPSPLHLSTSSPSAFLCQGTSLRSP